MQNKKNSGKINLQTHESAFLEKHKQSNHLNWMAIGEYIHEIGTYNTLLPFLFFSFLSENYYFAIRL